MSNKKKQFSQNVRVIKIQKNIFGQEFKGSIPVRIFRSKIIKKNKNFKIEEPKGSLEFLFFWKNFEFFGIFLNKPVYANLRLPNGEFLEVQLSVLFLLQLLFPTLKFVLRVSVAHIRLFP